MEGPHQVPVRHMDIQRELSGPWFFPVSPHHTPPRPWSRQAGRHYRLLSRISRARSPGRASPRASLEEQPLPQRVEGQAGQSPEVWGSLSADLKAGQRGPGVSAAPRPGQGTERSLFPSSAPAFFEDGVNVCVFMRPCERNVNIRKEPYLLK